MKKLALLISCVLILFSCEEVIEIEVPSGEPKLVIEAIFEVYFDNVPVTADTSVKLRLSADYFDEEIPVVTNAIVTLTNSSNNTTLNFEDINSNGNYQPSSSFIPEDDVEYELTVTYNNQVFKGRATKTKTPQFLSVEQGTKTLFSGKETEVKVIFPDDGSQDNFYQFDFANNLYLSIEDRFFNGSEYNFSFFYQEEEIEVPSTVDIKMSSVTKEYYTFFRVFSSQSGQSGGGPFSTIPSSLLGNIVNTTNSKNFPLGYFHIAETATYELNLTE
ncbi:DUF4249 family protein [Polaribacter sp. HL-MS24]|uniref:DUF4249 family protein n=1 Tax=Polaribacter sp. HL-MS24 TaxID=3077735 RepID=UPI002934347B|nr:DUF4249 family protein [Polaribacter sp. HL-MS24]WOC39854.1 DUF4249 family protein [Polaribacter sp. HL-MS24]